MQDYEEATAFLGMWGRFQQIMFFLLCICIIPNGIITFSSVFLADTPHHSCLIPDVNLTQDWLNSTIPKELYSNWKNLFAHTSHKGLVPGRDVNITELEQEDCLDGWSYSQDIYQSTLVSEFDLVCSEQWKQPFTSTIFLLGVLLGSLFSGQIADRFGRKPVMFATLAFQSISAVIAVFSPFWSMFAFFYFITGFGRVSSYVSAFVLGTEVLSGRVRVLFSSLGVCLSFTVGYMLLPLFAYFIRDWKYLLVAISLPGLMELPLWWFIPESPRWLLSQGKFAEAEAIIRKAAKINKVETPQFLNLENHSALVKEKSISNKKNINILHMLKTSNIRNITLIICLVWFTLRSGYYGLSLNSSQLHADPFISCFMSAAIEVPALIGIWLALRFLPRQPTVIFMLLLVAVSLFLIQLVPNSLSWMAVALEMVGKFAVTAGSNYMYVYVAEIYPTVLRNTATGSCSILSRAGSTTAPFLFKLKIYFEYLPYIILGVLSVASSVAALFLPETFNVPLPQTIEEMSKSRRNLCLFKNNRRKYCSSAEVVEENQNL
ncbi:organic cation/carnitine transporter 2-like isoform X2 [Takifugu flavidus]|uniref:organic cation/carnitine transporter 2-like isoform X2 n=1 Tax=Takifugu flavidus TaxID=433684 RepID=UPI0025446897|nr:organic cation/carnitine transporter 2-like isoform X2 [Takifugu flavidus]